MKSNEDDFEMILAEMRGWMERMTQEQRIRMIIGNYLQLEEIDEKLRELFVCWMFSSENWEIKSAVFEQYFHEMLDAEEEVEPEMRAASSHMPE